MLSMASILNIKSERRIETALGFFYTNSFIFPNIGNLQFITGKQTVNERN